MGKKGDKHTEQSDQGVKDLLSRLDVIGDITSKKMFGGYGLFHEGKMFGMVDPKGQAYFKTNELTAPGYIAAGSEKHGRMPYYTIPESVLTEEENIIPWAEAAIKLSKK